MNDRQISLRLPRKDLERLRKLARSQGGRSVTSLVREAIEEKLEEKPKENQG